MKLRRFRTHRPEAKFAMGLFAAVLSLSSHSCPANTHKQKSPFRVRYTYELPLLAASVSMTAVPVLFQSEVPPSVLPPLNRNNVFFLDRPATYYHSQSAARLSKALTITMPVLAVGASLPFGEKHWDESFEDILMLSECVAFTSLTNQIVRNAFRRPRPYLYQTDVAHTVSDREDLSSFFSGHTAMAFTIGISFWRIHVIRSPNHSANPYLLAGALTAGSAMAVSRVYSGYHFWTDVLVGGMLGSAVGFVITELHRVDDGQAGSLILHPIAPGGLAVGLRI